MHTIRSSQPLWGALPPPFLMQRFAIASFGAIGTTVILFMIMEWLIRNDGMGMLEPAVPIRYEIAPVIEDKPPARRQPKVIEPPEVEPPPVTKREVIVDIGDIGVPVTGPTVDKGSTDKMSLWDASGDMEPVSILKAPATYPERALQRGIEGYVLVEFDVTRSGNTTNIRILESVPEKTFDRTVERAIAKYRYQPKIVDGKSVMVYSVKNKITFKIPNA